MSADTHIGGWLILVNGEPIVETCGEVVVYTRHYSARDHAYCMTAAYPKDRITVIAVTDYAKIQGRGTQ